MPIKSSGSDELTSIFKTVGQPTVTYVERGSGGLEGDLNRSLNENGQLCLISGPSKTGKTTLYREVLRRRQEIPLVVRCDRGMSAEQIWLKALEAVDFSQASSRTSVRKTSGTAELEVSGKFGWGWLAQAATRLKGSISHGADETQVRNYVLAKPGSDLLIPILKETNYRLVIEDFHYLADTEKVILFEQWKRFTDSEVSVIVLGTTHRASEIASSNKDLVGRVSQIDVGNWGEDDLKKIARKGFDYIKVELPTGCEDKIASEAVGLPIIVQQTCLELVTSNGEQYVSDLRGKKEIVNSEKVSSALHKVAVRRYGQFEQNYRTLVSGPREKARRYRTYEIVLSCFTLDPIKFSMTKSELMSRISKLGLDADETPPPPSISSTLGALQKFQSSRSLELLEWLPNQSVLYVSEPAFLFFVRWRTNKDLSKVTVARSLLSFFDLSFDEIITTLPVTLNIKGPVKLPRIHVPDKDAED